MTGNNWDRSGVNLGQSLLGLSPGTHGFSSCISLSSLFFSYLYFNTFSGSKAHNAPFFRETQHSTFTPPPHRRCELLCSGPSSIQGSQHESQNNAVNERNSTLFSYTDVIFKNISTSPLMNLHCRSVTSVTCHSVMQYLTETDSLVQLDGKVGRKMWFYNRMQMNVLNKFQTLQNRTVT